MHSHFSHTKLTQSPRPTLGSLELRSGGGILSRPSVFLFLLTTLYFLFSTLTASAGTIHKPPNNLGLTAYWSFNEGTRTVATDFSGNGHHGTLAGLFGIPQPPTWVNGKFGKALKFITGQIGIANVVTFSPITLGTTHTVSMWVYLTGNCTGYGDLFSQDADTGLWCVDTTSGVGPVRANKIDYYFTGDHYNNTALTLNRWYHIAVVTSAGAATFYVNGVADGTAASAVGYNANTLGSDAGNETIPGIIDETRIYSRALSATEIANLYRAGAVKINPSLATTKIGKTRTPTGSLQTGLVGHWTFDGKDMYSNVADVSGNGNSGVLQSFTSTTTAIGKIGQALRFDGVNDYVDINATVGNFGTSDFSVSAWIKTTSDDGYIISKRAICGVGSFWNLRAGDGNSLFGVLVAEIYDAGGTSITVGGTRTIKDNQWHHVATVRSGTTVTIYVDGTADGSGSDAVVANLSNAANLQFSNNPCVIPFSGSLDDVRMYSKALSLAEIKQLYLLGK